MKLSRSKRLLVFGALSVTGATAWLLIAMTQEEPALKPWKSPFSAPTNSLPTAPILIPSAAEPAAPVRSPESSGRIAAIPPTSAPVNLPSPADATSQPESEEPTTEPAVQSVSTPAEPVQQVEGSRRMYQAHASFRTPEFADPDSPENRRVLQTMVTKALAK